jgi:hypothetical protein
VRRDGLRNIVLESLKQCYVQTAEKIHARLQRQSLSAKRVTLILLLSVKLEGTRTFFKRLQSPDIIASGDVMIAEAILTRIVLCPLLPKSKELSEEATI